MTTYFTDLLGKNNIPHHDGRTLWKYPLKENEYNQLRKVLSETQNLSNISEKDCALYYALWWQYGYNGGFARKEGVFNTFNNLHNFSSEDFYKKAKQGGRELGFEWIKYTHTHYFRTLLLQGGAPKKYCQENGGIYTDLLLNISASNPSSVNDIAPAYLEYLPKSLSENSEFLEFCLEICKNPEEFEEFIPDKNIIGTIKANNRQRQVVRTNFQTHWFLNLEEKTIYLEIETFRSLTKSEMADFLDLDEDVLERKYTFCVGDEFICDYIQLNNGEYKRHSFRNLKFDYKQESLINAEMIANGGEVYNCSQIIAQYPDFELPSLWAKVSDDKFKLEKGNSTAYKEALVLFFENEKQEYSSFTYGEERISYVEFSDAMELNFDDKTFRFNTNHSPFKWEMSYANPLWVKRSSIPMVTKNPKFKVFNKDNQTINAEVQYRALNQHGWTNYEPRRTSLPLGLIEFKITADNSVQICKIFYVGNLTSRSSSNDLRHSTFKFSNNTFDIQFYPNELFSGEVKDNLLTLELNGNKIPSSIKFRIKHPNQRKSVLFYMDAYFSGVELTENEEIVAENSIFCLDELKGKRLIADENHEYCLKLYNKTAPDLVRRIPIKKSITKLFAFTDVFKDLFSLSSPIAKGAIINIDIQQKKGDKYNDIKHFEIKRFSKELTISGKNLFLGRNLIAIPINSPIEYIQTLKINTNSIDDIDESLNQVPVDKFIIYEKQNDEIVTHTQFFSTEIIEDTEIEEVENSYTRVAQYAETLSESNPDTEIWQKILIHYQLCIAEGLPFSTFEPMRVLVESPKLIAKCFFFLAINNQEERFNATIWKKLEIELGFSALWIDVTFWNEAMDWIVKSYSIDGLDMLLFQRFSEIFSNHSEYKAYLFASNQSDSIEEFHLSSEIRNLRQNLGLRAIEELPQNVKVPLNNRKILEVTSENYLIKILLKAPVAIAESMLGLSTNLWGYSIEKDAVRRTMLYCQLIETERTDIDGNNHIYSMNKWFAKTILYSISKLKNQ